MNNHDTSYRLIFSHAVIIEDLLRDFVPEDWVARLDWRTLEKVGDTFVTDDLRSRSSDVIWRVRCGREWVYVYILLELQSTVDPFMAVRIMAYQALLYQDLIRTGEVNATRLLPPVLPVVLYNGERRWNAATDVREIIESCLEQLRGWAPSVRYLLLDEGAFMDSDLPKHKNLVAAIFRLENSRSPQDIRNVVASLREWLNLQEHAELRRNLTDWLRRVLLPRRAPGTHIPEVGDLQEMESMLSERVEEWTRGWREEGIAEGGALKLLEMAEIRFGEAPSQALRERVLAANEAQLHAWTRGVLEASSMEEAFGAGGDRG